MSLDYKNEREWLERHAGAGTLQPLATELQLRFLLDVAESLKGIEKALKHLDENYQWVLKYNPHIWPNIDK